VSELQVAPTSVPTTLPKGTSLVKFPKNDIGPQFTNKVLPWFETFWHKNKRYPEVDEIMGHFKFEPLQIEKLNCNKFWLNCLERRGIAHPNKRGELTPTQVATISLLANFSDRRPIPAKIAALGVSTEQLNGWYAEPEFQRELATRCDVAFDTSFPEVQASLMRSIQKGNFQATKFYYEITGRVQTADQINVQQAVAGLIEAVQKVVKDPEQLRAIGEEVRLMREQGRL